MGSINKPEFTQRSATGLTSMKAHFIATSHYFEVAWWWWWCNDALISEVEVTFQRHTEVELK